MVCAILYKNISVGCNRREDEEQVDGMNMDDGRGGWMQWMNFIVMEGVHFWIKF